MRQFDSGNCDGRVIERFKKNRGARSTRAGICWPMAVVFTTDARGLRRDQSRKKKPSHCQRISPPGRISTDHKPLFGFHQWLANRRILEAQEIKSVPYAPMSHPFH